ncbi:hypothetical protein DNTS_028896 [Danionella cerebrum]|uniref:Guanine nucleotide exchange factor VAV2 n=1 Tax=Danionella cerebrum TaxID=2873325 RepID=A0A553N4T7_9TELE|nr:hypothetical protein DNTS_028896 [Danionella translucida]
MQFSETLLQFQLIFQADVLVVQIQKDDGDDIYEDIIKVEVRQPMKMGMTEDDKRNCCLVEIQETEAKYYKTLEDIERNYMIPLKHVLTSQEMEAIFVNLEVSDINSKDIIRVHFSLLRAIDLTMVSGGIGLGKTFLDFKERTRVRTAKEEKTNELLKKRLNSFDCFAIPVIKMWHVTGINTNETAASLLIYGQYCSQMENAQKTLEELIASREDVKCKVEECTMKVQEGKFKLQDLLVVPMQRVLKYHLLLKELVSHSMDRPERQQLKEALEAMQDLAMYINEVKRDNETLKKISEFQSSIENLIDGELKVCSVVNRTKQDRYIFLFDKVVIVCKRKGYNYELKDIIELHFYKMSDDPTNNRDMKKSSGKMWSYGFYLIHLQGKQGFQFFCKTEDTKRKWMEQFEMAMSNIKPERATDNQHNFQMHTFDKNTNCRACKMLLRGIFYQGYYCSRCGTGVHKECLEVITICKISECLKESCLLLKACIKEIRSLTCSLSLITFSGPHDSDLGLPHSGPKMVAIRNYHGTPAPPGKMPLCFQTGEFIELLKGDPDTSWFAGNMERQQADNLLKSHSSGTYLIRERTAEAERFAISIKFNDEVKHIKVIEKDNWIHITEAKKFESLLELVEYYQNHSLKESFKLLDTTLRYPYKSRERSSSRTNTRSPAATCASYNFSFLSPQGLNFTSQSSAPFWSVFTPRVVSTAVARYNFAARDMRELSLREGDIVKIYSKIGGDQGWWKGEANGKIGWFPSTYVDEEGVQ